MDKTTLRLDSWVCRRKDGFIIQVFEMSRDSAVLSRGETMDIVQYDKLEPV